MNPGTVEVLLVEDSPPDEELALHALRVTKLTSKIFVVRDGEEALDFLFCRGPFGDRSFVLPPRLVLLDLKLPKVDGLEVLKEIKADIRTRAIPTVVLSSSKEEKDVVSSYHLGANSYIQKPVDYDQFEDAVKQLAQYWLVVNQPAPESAFRPQ